MWENWVQSRGWEDPMEKGKATHTSILTWRIPWTIQSMGSQSQTQLSNFHFHCNLAESSEMKTNVEVKTTENGAKETISGR